MDETKQSSGQGMGPEKGSKKSVSEQAKKPQKKKWTNKSGESTESQEVLIKVGSLEYKAPGRKQRVILGAIVLGGNLLLVLAAALYFYNPAFKDFVYNLGRWITFADKRVDLKFINIPEVT